MEEPGEGEEGGRAAVVVGVGEEVHEQLDLRGKPGDYGRDDRGEEGFALRFGEVSGGKGEPRLLAGFSVCGG